MDNSSFVLGIELCVDEKVYVTIGYLSNLIQFVIPKIPEDMFAL